MNFYESLAVELAELRKIAEQQQRNIALQAATLANLHREVQGLREDLRRAKIRPRPPNARLDAALQALVPVLAGLVQDRVFTAGEVAGHPALHGWTPRAVGRLLGYGVGQSFGELAIRQVAARTRDGSLWCIERADVTLPSGKLSHAVTPAVAESAARR